MKRRRGKGITHENAKDTRRTQKPKQREIAREARGIYGGLLLQCT